MTTQVIEKVTAFITHQTENGQQIVLLEHPYAGIQIPAGTVEISESPVDAVIREVFEETGLTIDARPAPIGITKTQLPREEAIILPPIMVYSRPDKNSFDWIEIRSAVHVKLLQNKAGFTQISFTEHDQLPDPNYISMQITGWVGDESLAQILVRHFFHINFEGAILPQWQTYSDHHTYKLFWAPLNNLPEIIPPQNEWVKYLEKFIGQ